MSSSPTQDALQAALREILQDRDTAMIAGKWYVIFPQDDARFERAALLASSPLKDKGAPEETSDDG